MAMKWHHNRQRKQIAEGIFNFICQFQCKHDVEKYNSAL